MYTQYKHPHSKFQVCMTCSGTISSQHSSITITSYIRHFMCRFFCPEHLYPLDVHAMFNYSWLIRDGCVSCVDLNARTTLPYVRHPTLPKDFIYAGFFNPFKMEAKIPSGVCWLVRQYPFYAQWQVSTMLLPHVNLQMLDPHTVIFSFVHNAPFLYIIYIL